MANAAKRAEENIRQITECSICMNGFTDPRMLPCIHTYCFACIKRTAETSQKKPGDKMPCPLCRKEFTIPREGIVGLQNNFFMENLMENLLEFKTTLQGNDPISRFGSVTNQESRQMPKVNVCLKHTNKPLDYYCDNCKKIVCVSCFVESHKLHDCKDVTTFGDEFRQMIENAAWKMSTFMREMILVRNNKEKSRSNFVEEIIEREKEIKKRNQELKDIIDRHTMSLLDELFEIKSTHLKIMETQMEEIERCCTILSNFEAYCTELRLKGSASDICRSFDQLIFRADEIEKDHEAFIGRPHQSVEITFRAADLSEALHKFNNNFVGNIQETTTQFENCAIVVGLNAGLPITKDVIKVNLQRSNEMALLKQIPTAMRNEAFAAVYNNTMYVIGIGDKHDKIWKYSQVSGWKKCVSLVKGRRGHSAAFIDEVLYICGGFVDSNKNATDSVEAYNAVDDKCEEVGELVHCVHSTGNCVPFRSSLYIFGGLDEDNKGLDVVQVYNTLQNTCTLLAKRMPRAYGLMRAVLWDTSAILLGCHTCFIFNFETETLEEREQFKTDVAYFGLVLENERLFVIGGGTLKRRDDVRYVPLQNIIDDKPIEWKIHAKLPKPSLVQAYAKMRFKVEPKSGTYF